MIERRRAADRPGQAGRGGRRQARPARPTSSSSCCGRLPRTRAASTAARCCCRRSGAASDYREPRTIDVHVRHLREKLERDPRAPEFILTVRGVGYRFRRPMAPAPERRRASSALRCSLVVAMRARDRLPDRRAVAREPAGEHPSLRSWNAPRRGCARTFRRAVSRTPTSSGRPLRALDARVVYPHAIDSPRHAARRLRATPSRRSSSADVEDDPSPLATTTDRPVEHGTVTSTATTATPRPRFRSWTGQSCSSARLAARISSRASTWSQRRLLLAAGRGAADRARCSGTAAPGCSRAGSGGSSGPPTRSPAVGSTSRLHDSGGGRARRARGRVRAHARAPGAARRRSPRVRRQRLARAADAAVLAWRLPRATRRRGARRGHAAGVPRLDAGAGRAADEARLRPARPHPSRRGPPHGRAGAGRPCRRSRRTSPRSSAPVARGTQHLLEVSPSGAGLRGRGRASGCSRSAGSWSRTRSCTRPRERRCGSTPGFTDDRAALEVQDDSAGHSRRPARPAVRALLPARRDACLRQWARSRDCEGAGGADGRHDRAGHRFGHGRCSR